MNPKVDEFIRKARTWRKEYESLRAILLASPLTEELKWGKPCYTFQGSNVVIVQGFKQFCALLFPKGALLKDARNILEKPGENTQSARRIPFRDVEEIKKLEATLTRYVKEAIAIEKAGLKVNFKKTADFEFPDELQHQLRTDTALKAAFEALTPGRQRAYLLHFSAAKQAKTRVSRIAKCRPRILKGLGLMDR